MQTVALYEGEQIVVSHSHNGKNSFIIPIPYILLVSSNVRVLICGSSCIPYINICCGNLFVKTPSICVPYRTCYEY